MRLSMVRVRPSRERSAIRTSRQSERSGWDIDLPWFLRAMARDYHRVMIAVNIN